MSTPVVVQGKPVGNPAAVSAAAPSYPQANTAVAVDNNNNNSIEQPHGGEKAETRCNDPIFALLFYACIAAIVVVAVLYGPAALDMDGSENNSNTDYRPMIIYVVIVAIISFFVCAGCMTVMMCIPATLIKISLIFSVVMSGVWAAMAFGEFLAALVSLFVGVGMGVRAHVLVWIGGKYTIQMALPPTYLPVRRD